MVEREFLDGPPRPDENQFETWLGAERTLWRTQGLEALVKSAEAQLARGDTAAATRAALGAVALDATSEPAARTAMRALALAGDRAAALRVGEDLARALRDALDAAPSPEMARLVERIREARVGRRIPAAPPAARPRPPLLGRAAELAAAAAAWQRAQAGRGQVVLVQGEPGEGKTRVLEELAARARLDDATVAAGRAVPADREREWSAVAGLVATGLGDAPGLASAPAPALASLGAIDPDLGTRFQRSRGEPAMQIAQAFTAAVIAAAGERPLLLVVDDAQWLDALSLALLPALARDAAPHRVLLLLGVARGVPDGERFAALQGRLGRDLEGAVIRLERLDQAALGELVAWAVPSDLGGEPDRLVAPRAGRHG